MMMLVSVSPWTPNRAGILEKNAESFFGVSASGFRCFMTQQIRLMAFGRWYADTEYVINSGDPNVATGSTVSNSSISTITGYCVYAEAQYGSNGDPSGAPEFDEGGVGGGDISGRIVWDTDTSDGLDSGWVAVVMTAPPGGGSSHPAVWAVGGGTPSSLNFAGQTYGTIVSVEIRAGVQIPAEFYWQNILVSFYRNGRMTEQYIQDTGPQVITTGDTPPVAAEQILTVTPQFNNNTQVVISGQIRLVCAEGIIPGADDIFGQIFVFTNSCA
jgi:hypothetical protein